MSNNDKSILKFLLDNPEGLRVKTIIKLTNLKQRTVYKRLNILRNKKLLENIFPIWKIINGQSNFVQTLLHNNNIFELHNLSYVVKLIKTPDWWHKRKNYLIRLKEWQFKQVNFGKQSSNPYQQLINENFVIQCYPESIIIISRKRYYSDNPYKTIQKAISDVLDLLEWLCERFKFDFFNNGIPHIQIRNNDFNRINDAIANQVKKSKDKFLIEIDKRRKVWVDKSEPFGKEANYPEAQEKLEKITRDYLTKDSLLPSEVATNMVMMSNNLNKIVTIQTMHSQNIVKHQKVLDEMLKTLKKIQKVMTKK